MTTAATTSPTPLDHAKSAADALRALDDLDPTELASGPQDVYLLLDHLAALINPLWRVSAALGRQLDSWADQRGLPRPAGQPVCALHIAADQLQADAPPHAMRLHAALDLAQHVLDPTPYRTSDVQGKR